MTLNPLPAKSSAARAYNTFNGAKFTIGTKATNTINVAVQLQDARGQNVDKIAHARVYLSDNADGSTLTATVPTSNIAVHTNGLILASPVTNKYLDVLTNSAGKFDLDLIQTASPVTYYLVVILPDGAIVVSSAITF